MRDEALWRRLVRRLDAQAHGHADGHAHAQADRLADGQADAFADGLTDASADARAVTSWRRWADGPYAFAFHDFAVLPATNSVVCPTLESVW